MGTRMNGVGTGFPLTLRRLQPIIWVPNRARTGLFGAAVMSIGLGRSGRRTATMSGQAIATNP